MTQPLQACLEKLEQVEFLKRYGRVEEVIGMTVKVRGPRMSIGQICWIEQGDHQDHLMAEVIGFQGETSLLAPYGDLNGVAPDGRVYMGGTSLKIPVGRSVLGRVLDGLGRPLDDRGPIEAEHWLNLQAQPPNALQRPIITQVLPTGVKVIDAFLTAGIGQRLGIFAGSGVGKSTLMGMLARGASADINVIGLIGERGREVAEFLHRILGPEGLHKSVVIVATSDQPALLRLKAALLATSVAEYFRDQGKQVLLLLDSVTRIAMAQREIGLAAGEPPTARGYTPSVFSLLPRLLERTGSTTQGSITAFYTVLVDGDDMNEPIADAVRGILDGHIVLSRRLAHENQFPAIDVLASVSRLQPQLINLQQRRLADELREDLAVYRQAEDLIQVGAYQQGSDPRVDRAMRRYTSVIEFMRQDMHETVGWEDTWTSMESLVSQTAGAKAG